MIPAKLETESCSTGDGLFSKKRKQRLDSEDGSVVAFIGRFKQPTLHKGLLLLVFIMTIVAVVFLVLYLNDHIRARPVQTTVCLTPECVMNAGRMLSNMNMDIDPCEDFYTYACGGWLSRNTIPESRFNYESMSEIEDSNDILMKNFFDREEESKPGECGAIRKVRQLYNSCNRVPVSDEPTMAALSKLLSELNTIGALNESWKEDDWSLEDSLAWVHRFLPFFENMDSPYPLFHSHVQIDDKEPTKNTVILNPPGLPLMSDSNYLEEDSPRTKDYINMIEGVFKLLPGRYDFMDWEYLAKQIFDLETAISKAANNISINRMDQRKSHHRITIKDFIKSTGSQKFDWVRFLNGLFVSASVQFSENDMITTTNVEYFESLPKILGNTNKRLLANYITYITVLQLSKYLSAPFRHFDFLLSKITQNITQQLHRWKICLLDAERLMPQAYGSIYVKQTFDSEDRKKVAEIIESIKETFKDTVASTEWLDKKSKDLSVEKIENMWYRIGFDDRILDCAHLEKEYRQINVTEGTYFQAVVQLLNLNRYRQLEITRYPPIKSNWILAPSILNALYQRSSNRMDFFAAILQSPIYNPRHPMVLNFAGIGDIIGHEITHSLDAGGRLYNKDGVLTDEEWWSEESMNEFHRRAQCLVEQYSGYTLHSYQIDGNQTLDENIADNAAIGLAFRAYTRWQKEKGITQTLPGLNVTDKQLFFLSSVQQWCSLYPKDNLLFALRTSSHTLGSSRVTGKLVNSADFATAFNCRAGSKMNPIKKCTVWN